jgi:hypothetical protein
LKHLDDEKQELLLKNMWRVPGMAHLVHSCEDRNLSHDMSANCLAKHAIILDQENTQAPKRLMTVTDAIAESVPSSSMLTMNETTLLFANSARESSLCAAYQAFNNRDFLQNLQIPDDIWHALEPSIKEKINALRAKIKAEREAKATPQEVKVPQLDNKPAATSLPNTQT